MIMIVCAFFGSTVLCVAIFQPRLEKHYDTTISVLLLAEALSLIEQAISATTT